MSTIQYDTRRISLLITKGHAGSEKTTQVSSEISTFQKHQSGIKNYVTIA